MRIRSLKPSFFENEDLGVMPVAARLLFSGLWCCADREGRLKDRPRRLKGLLFPYDDIASEQIDEWLAEFARLGMVRRYEVDGEPYMLVVNFLKYQHPHTSESPSLIPPPPGFDTEPASRPAHQGQPPHARTPDTGLPDTGLHSLRERARAIDDEFLTTILDEYTPKLGSRDKAQLEIDACLNHKAYDKARDKRQYVRVWLRRSVEFHGPRAPARAPVPSVSRAEREERRRLDLIASFERQGMDVPEFLRG